ncbi:MAG: hypothetical protein H6839_15865 [Planctomycetes bacterium]|nr:hypothetical protein [Planctomycetota bacterium]
MKYLLPLLFVLVAGCTSLQYALETAERTRDAMESAGAELRDAMEIAQKARDEYVEALKDGDGDRVQAALVALQAAEDERRTRELRFEQTQKAFDTAKHELDRAKAEDNYLEGVLGILLGGLIGGGGGFLTGRKKKP